MQGHVPHHGVPYMCNHLENPQAVIVGSLDLDVDVGEPKNVSRTREGITYLGKSNAMRFTKSLRVRTCCRIQEAGGDDNAALKSVKKVLRCFATTYQIRQRRGGPSPPPTLTVLPAQPMPPITTRTPPPPTLTIPIHPYQPINYHHHHVPPRTSTIASFSTPSGRSCSQTYTSSSMLAQCVARHPFITCQRPLTSALTSAVHVARL